MLIPFDALPPESRIWIFGSDRALIGDDARRLLRAADDFLEEWQAHGEQLRCARQWIDDRFLVIGVDPTTANASGCSIDGLFRAFRVLEGELGTRLVAGGRVFYRDAQGVAHPATRPEFERLATQGVVGAETPIFDTSLTSAEELRRGFERPAGETWVSSLLGLRT
jgi:hypothetical protein